MKKILISLIAIVSVFMITGCSSKDNKTNESYNNNNLTNETSSDKVDDKLNYAIPQGFKTVSEGKTLFEYEYESDDANDYCSITIEIMTSYYDSLGMKNYKEYFESQVNSKDIKSKNINNNEWYVNENNNKYNYGIEKNNIMYTISYEIDDDATGYCSSAKNIFENSLEF
ncbi:MAG: hypothetical protein IJ105_03805 [Bacilli bacterium]|nr:hypothetical protein [Bacilli bacterium]